MIHFLLSDGLMKVGDRGEGGGFEAWDEPLEEVMQKISDSLVNHHGDRQWPYFSWFKLTDKGRQLALSTEEGRRIARDVQEELAERPQS
jgi:hypothetical protein